MNIDWILRLACFPIFRGFNVICALNCFACKYDPRAGDQCVTQPNSSEVEHCKSNFKCQVWKFYSEVENQKIYYFERSCSDKCIAGCTSLDDMENRFISCKSCCNRNFCNVDSASVTIHVFHESSIYVFSLFVILLFSCKF